MNILGIIAEFNPLHRGHSYLMEKAKQMSGANYTIVIMSGNFTQRGEPAIYDKQTRTRWALACGADLVIEMPAAAACASAKDFARCGVGLLAATGIVTHLAFGCENAELPRLSRLSKILRFEPDPYKDRLKESLRQGLSWPAARSRALAGLVEDTPELLKQPNNILALEYLAALEESREIFHHTITPLPVQRIHAGYHDPGLEKPFCSATALRQAILQDKDPNNYLFHFPDQIKEDAAKIICREPAITSDDLSSMVGLCLLNTSEDELLEILDMDPSLKDRIINQAEYFSGFNAFANRLVTRAYTRTRISRILIHLLLNMKNNCRQDLLQCSYAPYIRILGFKKDSAPLLGDLKKSSLAPVISRPAAALRQLISPDAQRLFRLDVHAAEIYQNLQSIKKGSPVPHEFRQKVVIL